MTTTLVFEFFGRDNSTSRVLNEIGRNSDGAGRRLKKVGDDAKNADGPLDHLRKTLNTLSSSLLNGVKSAAQMTIKAGGLASTAITLAPLLGKAAGQVISVGQAAVSASPALLALAAGGLFVKATLAQIGPAIGKSLEPVTSSFTAAGAAAGLLASKGVRPLAAEFAKVGMPIIAAGMDRIAVATNGVVKRTLEWARSSAGITAIRNTINATSSATEMLGPHISRLVESFGNMIGRIAGVSMAAGSSGLAGVLDKLSGWMDRVNAATVQGGLDSLKEKFHAVRDAVEKVIGWVKQGVQFWHQYRTEIMIVQDTLSILAIAFGGPVVAVIAAVGIIIRHWDQLKAVFQSVVAWFQTPVNIGFLENLKQAAATVWPPLKAAFEQIKAAVMPVLSEIWDKVQNQLIPAFGSFIQAIAPVVAFFISVLGPVVAGVMHNILGIISGVITIITGIFNVFAGLLTGNWSQLWTGIKQIFSGAWEVIINYLQLAIFGRIGRILGEAVGFIAGLLGRAGWAAFDAAIAGIGALVRWMGGVGGRVLGALGDLGGLLWDAGKAVIGGLLRGIVAGAEAVFRYVSGIASKIASLKGPLPKDRQLLVPAGGAMMAGLHAGILQGLGPVLATVGAIAGQLASSVLPSGLPALPSLGALGATGTPGGRQGMTLTLNSGGSRLDDLLVELLRKAIRSQGGNVQGVLGA